MCRKFNRMFVGSGSAILTFAFGVGLVIVWQSFTRADDLIEVKSNNLQSARPPIIQQKIYNVCDEERLPPKIFKPKIRKHYEKSVSGGVLNSKVCVPLINYSQQAKTAGANGKANVEVSFDEEGYVRFAKFVSGDELVKEAVVEAALQARMPPPFLRGQPVRMKGNLIFEYDLSKF